jgi:Protein of unknown function (DUF2971)
MQYKNTARAGELKRDGAVAAQTNKTEASAQQVINSHPELYHYTSGVGLKGIVESNSFWATYFGDLNDTQEIHTLRVPLVDELAERLNRVVREARLRKPPRDSAVWKHDAAKLLARIWGNALYRGVFANDEPERTTLCCITSFCSHAGDKPYEREHGLLSQWRRYGKNGGFCLVFDAAALWKLFEQEQSAYLYPYTDVREAFYLRENSKWIDCFLELLDTSEAVIETALSGNRDFVVDDEVLLPFLSSATAFKHEGFYEEREVRFVAVAGTELAAKQEREAGREPAPLKEVFKTIRDKRERRHIALFGKDFEKLPLRRVIVGPSRSQDSNVTFAQKIVGTDVPVSKSATPYIG